MKRVRSLENVATIGDGSDGMPGKPSKKGKPKPKISGSNCDMCTLACSKELQCYVCSKLAHLRCCGVPKGNTEIALHLVQLFGWACGECKTSFQMKFHQGNDLEDQMKEITQDVSTLKAKVEELGLKGAVGNGVNGEEVMSQPTVTYSNGMVEIMDEGQHLKPTTENWTEVKKTIAKEVRDSFNRRKNVVVSGFVDPGINSAALDQTSFSQLCENEFKFKPNVMFAKRLGQPSPSGNPRRLLVGLSTEEEALRITQLAKNLRKSSDPLVSSAVYIYPHLSPEESKLQYVKRQNRREQKARNSSHNQTANAANFSSSLQDFPPLVVSNPSGIVSNLNPAATSFKTPVATRAATNSTATISPVTNSTATKSSATNPTDTKSSVANSAITKSSVTQPSATNSSSVISSATNSSASVTNTLSANSSAVSN